MGNKILFHPSTENNCYIVESNVCKRKKKKKKKKRKDT